jgi:ABC-type ATPase with predicted acetyltransferase domain
MGGDSEFSIRESCPGPLVFELAVAYNGHMTAVEIIEEIKRLSREEQNQVIDFVRKAGEIRRLTPDELGALAKEMAEAKDSAEADRLQAEIVRGFYGSPADA